jgi:HSP20 family protein
MGVGPDLEGNGGKCAPGIPSTWLHFTGNSTTGLSEERRKTSMSSYVSNTPPSIGSQTLDRQIDRLLEDAVRAFGASTEPWVPACNVWDDENGFYIQMALPGWEANQMSLEVNSRMLTVKGERRQPERSDGVRYHLEEFGGHRFARMFRLPSVVDHDKASATHKNGILTISFPKREEAKCRRILIAAD